MYLVPVPHSGDSCRKHYEAGLGGFTKESSRNYKEFRGFNMTFVQLCRMKLQGIHSQAQEMFI